MLTFTVAIIVSSFKKVKGLFQFLDLLSPEDQVKIIMPPLVKVTLATVDILSNNKNKI